MRLVAYTRVSTDRQAEEGRGLEVQRRGITHWARGAGHRVVLWTVDEGVSGSNGVEAREGLPVAIEAVQRGRADGVVVYSLDRLARRLTAQEAIFAHVWDAGGRLFSVDEGGEVPADDPDDPMRTAIRQMRGVFHQLDRSLISKRLRDGRRAKAAAGGYAYGAPPFGFRSEAGALVLDHDQHATLLRAGELHRQGESIRRIAEVLGQEGHRTKRGGTRWHPTTVARMLQRGALGTVTATS